MDERLSTLIEAMGYDPSLFESEEDFKTLVDAAAALGRVRMAMLTSRPDKTGSMFICGVSGVLDGMGLPQHISVCPTYGLSGSAVYTKTRGYEEPGY